MTNRIRSVDFLRGVAIIGMVFGNGAILLERVPPLAFRGFISFFAPLFISIAGMMVALGITGRPDHRLPHYLKRALFILIVGALVDVCVWRIIPGTTVDVLYCIGVSLPFAYLLSRCGRPSLVAATIVTFLAGLLLQHWLGYTDYPFEWHLDGTLTTEIARPTGVVNHWFVDGWFPLFPWTGFAFFGALLGKIWQKDDHLFFSRLPWPVLGLAFVIGGGLLWFYLPGELLVRQGYVEAFYPPTPGFLITSVGVLILLFACTARMGKVRAIDPVLCLGEAPLAMYVLHLVVIGGFFEAHTRTMTAAAFLFFSVSLVIALVLIGYGLRLVRHKWAGRPVIVRWAIG